MSTAQSEKHVGEGARQFGKSSFARPTAPEYGKRGRLHTYIAKEPGARCHS